MIDAHSHVLPGMDDGSRSVRQSLSMLQKMAEQGITTAAATPHFYASSTEPSRFFEKRQAAKEKLLNGGECPVELRLGAEVLYYEGLQKQERLMDFRIEGTQLFLLEMPFGAWSDRAIRGILDLNTQRNLTVVLAHIDRYLAWQPISVFEELASRGVLMQVNAGSLLHWQTRRKTLQLFLMGLVQFIGSDCHDDTERAPNVASAMAVLEKKLGPEAVSVLLEAEEDMVRCREYVV